MSPFVEAFFGSVVATIFAAPIYTGIAILIIRFWNKHHRKSMSFLVGDWHSEYEVNSEMSVKEKIQIRENIWHNKLIIKSIDSDPPNYSWVGHLILDDNSTAYGTWENTSNPSRHGYCVFHITRENTLVGYTITTKRDSSAGRHVGDWKVTPITQTDVLLVEK